MSKAIAEVIEAIQSRHHFVVVSHQNIDGDGIGALLSFYALLSSLNKHVVMVNDGNVPYFCRFLPDTEKILSYEDFCKAHLAKGHPFETLIVVDCSNLSRLGKMSEMVKAFSFIINVDHHPDNSFFGNVNWVVPEASSTMLVYTLFKEMGVALNKSVASSILNGLISDTGGFSFVEVDSKMFTVLEDLVAHGASVSESMRHNFRFRRSEALKLLGRALERLVYDGDSGISYTYLVRQDFVELHAEAEDTEGIVDYGLYIPGAEISILFRETEEKVFKVSLRAQGEREVLSIAHHFGGGGHLKAAGFKIAGELEVVIQEVLGLVQNVLYGPKTAMR
ncbi:MAG: bifunctional oligoribonuclease/PAP phosphatase NrnA [Candidatus Atribacteria bacterium]|nr:bifunctional oligoribonuclease/PAP phosphatase NrnA [Candidatus Atribacteria bacterium]